MPVYVIDEELDDVHRASQIGRNCLVAGTVATCVDQALEAGGIQSRRESDDQGVRAMSSNLPGYLSREVLSIELIVDEVHVEIALPIRSLASLDFHFGKVCFVS